MSNEDCVPTFSIVIPTCGRDTLGRTLQSIVDQGGLPTDEVIVVGDGPQPVAEAIVESFSCLGLLSVRYFEHGPHRQTGGPQRNFGMSKATGTHMIFIDDDDIYVDGAIRAIRAAVALHPEKVLLFKEQGNAVRHSWGTVWKTKEVKHGNVGTQSVVVPNVQGRIGEWGTSYSNDWDFIRSTVDLYPNKDGDVVWMDRVIVHLY